MLTLAVLEGKPIQIGQNTEEVLRTVQPLLPRDPVIVEAGGFDGTDTIKVAQFWPLGSLHTFEPVPELFAVILNRISGYFGRVRAYPLALADYNGTSVFYLSVHRASPGSVGGSSSLLEPKEHLIYDRDISFPRTITVQTRKLDDWAKDNEIPKVDFLWLDMQGYDLNMVMASELAKNARAIYIESLFVEAYKGQYLYRDIKKWMLDNGFVLMATDFDEDTIEIDLIVNKRYYGNALFIKR